MLTPKQILKGLHPITRKKVMKIEARLEVLDKEIKDIDRRLEELK
jgi:hypothetical protein